MPGATRGRLQEVGGHWSRLGRGGGERNAVLARAWEQQIIIAVFDQIENGEPDHATLMKREPTIVSGGPVHVHTMQQQVFLLRSVAGDGDQVDHTGEVRGRSQSRTAPPHAALHHRPAERHLADVQPEDGWRA